VLDDYLSSMEAVAPYMNRRICFSHYGACSIGMEIVKIARQQLLLWVDVIKKYADTDLEQVMGQIINDLSDNDPVYAQKELLPPEFFQRELHFSVNSIKGIFQYLNRSV
jgi:hypothetical protein